MRPLLSLTLAVSTLLISCKPPAKAITPPREVEASVTEPAEAAVAETPPAPAPDIRSSLVRVNSTQQSWNDWQPWEKNAPDSRRALGAIVGPGQVLTTAELVHDATYLEFESADGVRFCQAKVLVADYEANLALLVAMNEENGAEFFTATIPLVPATPSVIGDGLEIVQVEDNGQPIRTQGSLYAVDTVASLQDQHSFLTYLVKASMQSAASSYSLPVLREGKLAGLLVSYDSKDQVCEVVATDILSRFLESAKTSPYLGFPSLGVATARTEDPSFRQWLGLADDQGGIYIKSVQKGSSAETAGVKAGDVLLAIDGMSIDRRGYYQDASYDNVFWGHLVRGRKASGETITLSLLRGKEPVELTATLSRIEEQARLVPHHLFDRAPNFLVKGGMLFQELSKPQLEAFGKNWDTNAPLPLLDAFENPDRFEEGRKRIVYLSGVIPTPATVGYEPLRSLVISKINGKEIVDMKSAIAAFDSNLGEIHSIEFLDEKLVVYLDDSLATAVDGELLKRGMTRLSRSE